MRQRPMATLIFGILNIAYALLYLAGPLMALLGSLVKSSHPNPVMDAMKADPGYVKWNTFNMGLSVVFFIALLAFGIGLLLLKNWARLGSIIYAMIAIVMVPISSMITMPYMKRAMQSVPNMPQGMAETFAMVTMVAGIVIGMGYPALLLWFMTRSNVIEACQAEEDAAPAQEPS